MKGGEETKDIYGIFYSDKINLEQGKLKKKKSVGFKVNYQTIEEHSASICALSYHTSYFCKLALLTSPPFILSSKADFLSLLIH